MSPVVRLLTTAFLPAISVAACGASFEKFRLCSEDQPTEFIQFDWSDRTFSTSDYLGAIRSCGDSFAGFCIREPLPIAVPADFDLHANEPSEWRVDDQTYRFEPLDDTSFEISTEATWGEERYVFSQKEGLVARLVRPTINGEAFPEETWKRCAGRLTLKQMKKYAAE